jgi:hypothetical protein
VELLPEDVGLAGSGVEAAADVDASTDSAAGVVWQAVPALSDAAFAERQALLRQKLQGLDVQELVM